MIKLALEQLIDGVKDTFDAERAQVFVLETANFAGTASIDAGPPTDFAEVVVLFTTGGDVGTPGIVYKISTDDGATYGTATSLDVGTTIQVVGVTLTVGGTINDGDFLRWQTTSPIVVEFAFGTRAPWKRGDHFKISYVPGDDANAGEIAPVQLPGRNPRPLYTFEELVSVYVEADDIRDAENERAQWRACRLLLNAWLRSVYKVSTVRSQFQTIEVLKERSTRRHGWAYRVVLQIEAMVPDVANTTAPSNTKASVTTEMVANDVVIQTDGPDVIAPSGD